MARALGYDQGCPDSIPAGVDVIRAGLVGFEAGVSPNTFVSHGSRRYETCSMYSVLRSTQEGYIATSAYYRGLYLSNQNSLLH
jgi:hypothetical protein